MTREEKELIVKVIASATDKVSTETFCKLTKYFFEPRSCNSCKWYEEYPSVCCNGECPLCADVVPSDFYCKYWENKDETVSL